MLISPIGASPTGEIFNLAWEEVAETVADRGQADKLIFSLRCAGRERPEGQPDRCA